MAGQNTFMGRRVPWSGIFVFLVGNTAATPAGPPLPAPTTAPDLTAASDTGVSSTDDITDNRTPTLTGAGATPGETVTVYAGAVALGTTTADASGNWTFTTPSMSAGVHLFAWDQGTGGRRSGLSPTLSVTVQVTGGILPLLLTHIF